MISIHETRNPDNIEAILRNPTIWKEIAPECMSPEDFILELDDRTVFVLGFETEIKETVGLLIFEGIGQDNIECHIQVLPEYRKLYAKEFAENALAWMAMRAEFKKLTAKIPTEYMNVVKFAQSVGFRIERLDKIKGVYFMERDKWATLETRQVLT